MTYPLHLYIRWFVVMLAAQRQPVRRKRAAIKAQIEAEDLVINP